MSGDEMGRTRSTHSRDEKCVQNFGRKTEGTRSLGRPKRRWEDNIRMVVREIGLKAQDWIHLAQDRD
jgi:hypothetical protein